MVLPNTDLKRKIEEWIQEKEQKQKKHNLFIVNYLLF